MPDSAFPYTIQRKLADGGPTEVFLGAPLEGGAQVVLKVLRPELVSDPSALGRFLDEAKVCAGFNHPNVIRHLGVCRLPDGRTCLVTELLEGEDLETHLRLRGPIDPSMLLSLAAPLCEALDYVHGKGVVHRDLKPDNVFLVGGLTALSPKLLDFGLANFPGPKSVRTAAGVMVSTPEYMAPECIQGQKADRRSDLYSFGVLLYEALSGAPPFTSSNYGELLLKHLHEEPPPLPSHCAHLAPAIHRCLAKDPAERFASATEFSAALLAATGALKNTFVSSHGSAGPGPGATGTDLGEQLGPYRVVRRLGEGAMGEVLLARHARLGRQVAIKMLKPEHASNGDLVQRFFQEARTVNAINHEHIVEIFDFIEETGPTGKPRVYFVMELIAGMTLSQLLREERLTIQRTIAIARQICGALEAAHRVGVVHRDIKPDNIFITERSGLSDYVKVLDFGVAKLVGPIDDVPKVGTMAGTIIGTPAYMAPEQACGAGADARSDVYALGIVLYEMLTGRVPFGAEQFQQLVVQILTEAPPPLGARSLGCEPIPRALEALVMQCLKKKPEDRPATMAEISDELESIGRGELRLPLESEQARPRRGLWKAALLSGSALAAAAALASSFFWPPADPPAQPSPSPAVARTAQAPDSAAMTVVLPAAAQSEPPTARPVKQTRRNDDPKRSFRPKRGGGQKRPDDPDGMVDPFAE